MLRPAGFLAFIPMLLWAGTALAETFMVDGAALELPAPDGFCYRPSVPMDDPRNADVPRRQPPAAQIIAMAEPCGAAAGPSLPMNYGRWLLLLDNGQPRRFAAPSTRASFVKSSIEGRPLLIPGMVFQLGFMSPNPASGLIGHDAAASYWALVYPVSSPLGGSVTQAGIGAETVLHGRVLAFQLFATYQDDETYTPLEAQVKAVMAQAVKLDTARAATPRPEADRSEAPSYDPPLELIEVVWLLGKALLIAAVVFAASAYLFGRRSGGRR